MQVEEFVLERDPIPTNLPDVGKPLKASYTVLKGASLRGKDILTDDNDYSYTVRKDWPSGKRTWTCRNIAAQQPFNSVVISSVLVYFVMTIPLILEKS